jgi:hypothetical protein
MRRFYDDKLGGVTQPSQRRYSAPEYRILAFGSVPRVAKSTVQVMLAPVAK